MLQANSAYEISVKDVRKRTYVNDLISATQSDLAWIQQGDRTQSQ